MQKLIIENTLYSLLMFWLKEKKSNEIYILDTSINEVVRKKLKENNKVYIFNSYNNENPLKRFILVYLKEKKKLKKILKRLDKEKIEIYGNDDLVSFDVFRNFNYVLLEDGIMNYEFEKQRQKGKFKTIFRDLLRGFHKNEPFGLSKNCKKILLTGLAPIPKKIAHKVEIINIKELWDKKSEEEQEEILDIFSFTNETVEKLKHRDIILLTQPISEDGFVTEQEKIEIYKKSLEKYDLKDVIIKIHPREKTNYSKYFPDVLILDNPFPFELVTLMEIKFNKAITLFSTVALSLGVDVEVEWLGAKVHPKLEKRFGNTLDLHKFKKK